MISEFVVKNYRSFGQLEIRSLGRVNLIVGRGNSGKTSLLESLFLFCSHGDALLLYKVLGLRIARLEKLQGDQAVSQLDSQWRNPDVREFVISGKWNGQIRECRFSRVIGDVAIPLRADTLEVQNGDITSNPPPIATYRVDTSVGMEQVSGNLSVLPTGFEVRPVRQNLINARYVTLAEPLLADDLPTVWTEAEGRGKSDDILALLGQLDPNTKDIRVGVDARRQAFIRVYHATHGPVPLETQGAGFVKALAIATKVYSAANGILLIDDFEAGLHVSVVGDVIAFALKAAAQFKVQLFIATHSLETVDAFIDCADSQKDLFGSENDIRVFQIAKERQDRKIRNIGADELRVLREELGVDLRRTV